MASRSITPLSPLFKPWEYPSHHRVADSTDDADTAIEPLRRHSDIAGVNLLRYVVDEWRKDGIYPGVSKTTRALLRHWFFGDHTIERPDGTSYPFHYYFCQREAIETLVYLIEVCRVTNRYGLMMHMRRRQMHRYTDSRSVMAKRQERKGILEFDDGRYPPPIEALGIDPEDDRWGRYAFKMATGSGKTKCMSLAIVWSYFHALFEKDSPMTRHFLAIAPSLTVFERLRQDFYPETGRDIFQTDPLIPPEWQSDWRLSVRLQDSDTSGAPTDDGGVLYLTNIHRLYPSRLRAQEQDGLDVLGESPAASSRKEMRDRLHEQLASHKRLMVLNDEAHHVWDPGSAWSQAINSLHDTIYEQQGEQERTGVIAQLDFSATPKDNQGALFSHIICDTPLGEAVDGGIVKTPIIGKAKELQRIHDDDAAIRHHDHLLLGYKRWLESKKEWEKSGVTPLMFVMCEDTDSANQITDTLNKDGKFAELHGKVINLHTRLQGKMKKVGTGKDVRWEFVEKETGISDDDLRQLRQLSRDLDSPQSPYRCIVSVLMLREGWDVRNVTVIVPLRAYTARSDILPEQTLGRGLRRIAPNQDVDETVVVIDHPQFLRLYRQALASEGLPIAIIDANRIKPTTVSIFVDKKNKKVDELDITIPHVSGFYQDVSTPEPLTQKAIDKACQQVSFAPLQLGKKRADTIKYQGRHYLTDELVEEMSVNIPLLKRGMTPAISFYVKELKKACHKNIPFPWLAPHIAYFITHRLFGKLVDENDSQMDRRLGDDDVRGAILHVFVPLVNRYLYRHGTPALTKSTHLKDTAAHQKSHSEKSPAVPCDKTLFNLVPCDSGLEQRFAQFLDGADDVVAFCKNAGPQALRITYLNHLNRPCSYIPDFIVRLSDGKHALIELKGQEKLWDSELKAQAAEHWCQYVTKATTTPWHYTYIPEHVLQETTANQLGMVMSTCETHKQEILATLKNKGTTLALPFTAPPDDEGAVDFFTQERMDALSPNNQEVATDSYDIYTFLKNREGTNNYAPAFQPFLPSLDKVAEQAIIASVRKHLPKQREQIEDFFEASMKQGDKHQIRLTKNIMLGVRHGSFYSALGTLSTCIDYALHGKQETRKGVQRALQQSLKPVLTNEHVLSCLQSVNNFRNRYVAHYSEQETPTQEEIETMLRLWAETLGLLETLLHDLTRDAR